jgi:predicted DNA-binding protein (MmcQ/YjbR family)
MKPIERIRKIALSFPETTEQPHFDKTSFRVKKKIFATCTDSGEDLCVKLSEIDQNVFGTIETQAIYPVPNKWGKQGWTMVIPAKLSIAIVKDILTTAYCTVAPAKLANQIHSKRT